MSENINHKISLESGISEIINYYEKETITKKLTVTNKKVILENEIKELTQILNFILERPWICTDDFDFGDWRPEFLLFGHFFDGLLNIILINELGINEYITIFDEWKKSNLPIGHLNRLRFNLGYFLKLQKIQNLEPKQKQRVSSLLEYIILQRNRFHHYNPKNWDIYVIRYQIFKLTLRLIELFKLAFPSMTIGKLKKLIEQNEKTTHSAFERVW